MGAENVWLKGLLLALAPSLALGGVNSWTSIGPEGGDVRRIVRHPTNANIIYLSSLSGFYRSTNGGESWQLVKDDYGPYPTDIEVDIAHPNRVFVAGNTQPSPLLVSEDAGATLAPVPGFLDGAYVHELDISPDGQTIYTIGSERGTRSTDGGATWDWCGLSLVNSSYPRVISIDPNNPNTVYASHVERMFVSTNGCETWAEVSLPPEIDFIYELKVSPTNSDQLWLVSNRGLEVSSNGGANWTPILSGVATIEFDPTDPSILYTTDEAQLLRSEDEGHNWVTFNTTSPTNSIATIALGHSQVYVGGLGVAVSTINDTAWEKRGTGILGLPISSFAPVAQSDRIYMSSWNAPLHYIDGTGSRTEALPQHPNSSGDPIFLAQPGAGADHLIAAFGATELGVSSDGGNSWHPIGTRPLNLSTLHSWSSEPQIILGGAYQGMYRSENGGADWEPVNGLPTDTFTTVATTVGESEGIAYVAPMESSIGGTNGLGVYKSVDYGANWVPVNTGIENVSVRAIAADPIAGEFVYGTTDDGLIRSTDAGESWSSLTWPELNSDDTPLVVAVDAVRPETIYVASRYTVARSIDAGTSWQLLRQVAVPEWWPLAIVSDPVRSGSVLLATTSFGVQRFDVLPDLALEASGPTRVGVGVTAQLTFTALNFGPYHATTPRVTLQLPVGASNIQASSPNGDCNVAGLLATCTFDVLRAGFSHVVTLLFTPANDGEASVSATIAGDQSDVDTSNNATSIEFQTMELADLTASITAPASATAGQSFSYSAIIANTGPNGARDVEVTMQLANGLTLGTITSSRGTCSSGTAAINCVLGLLPAGESATIEIAVSAPNTGDYAATVSASTVTFDEVSDNNTASASITVTTTSTQPSPNPGGSGGGGSSSLALLLALGLLSAAHRRGYKPRSE